ncbi:MAG: hypothetical protein EAZ97_04020 [Bacteroidetes bacterium]|nr:MAG: hypothetical protein EAZ97_04020 [Bacteroidota bacterium]
MIKLFALFLVFFWGNISLIFAQDFVPDSLCTDSLIVRNIHLDCLKKTKSFIVSRELAFTKGSKISKHHIYQICKREANKIFNTDLFVIADLIPIIEGDSVDLLASVIEKWYFYPIPILELADRNFNEWWQQRNHDLGRINYGMRFRQQNFRGRNEDLRFNFQFGFTQLYELEYLIPYIDRKKTIGLSFSLSYANNKNMPFKTTQNKLDFLGSENILNQKMMFGVSVFKRNAFYNSHFFSSEYRYNQIADTVAFLNPNYFLKGKKSQYYVSLQYDFVRDVRNMAAYPLTGMYFKFSALHRGLGFLGTFNKLQFSFLYAHFFKLNPKFYLATSWRGLISFPELQPFPELRSFGYGSSIVRGYELYVIDTQNFAIWKNTLRWQLFSTEKRIDKIIGMEQFSTLPLSMYLKIYADLAYAQNTLITNPNDLANRLLAGGGIGLDTVASYNLVLRLEYSWNRENKNGFFMGFRADF